MTLWPQLRALIAAATPHISPDDAADLAASSRSYCRALEDYFGIDHELGAVVGQLNALRYQAVPGVILRVSEDALAPTAARRLPWLQDLHGSLIAGRLLRITGAANR